MFSLQLIALMKQHAVEAYPHESCGLVVSGEYIRIENVADKPEDGFVMPSGTYLKYADAGLEAVVHSHPDGPAHPSLIDMQQQQATGIPWGVIMSTAEVASDPVWFGEGAPIPDLVGRSFCHGVTDCYAIIKDWYALERGIKLPDFPRSYDWWVETPEADMYRQNFKKAGFSVLKDPSDVKVGDVFLAQVRSTVPNHGGVYIGDGLIIHHLVSRLSCRQPLQMWNKAVVTWLRYTGVEDE